MSSTLFFLILAEAPFRRARAIRQSEASQNNLHSIPPLEGNHEYAKTKDVLYVQKLLSHRNLKTPLRYTQLLATPQNEEYICKVAKSVQGTKDLVEARFEYVTEVDGCKLSRKIKTSYLGS